MLAIQKFVEEYNKECNRLIVMELDGQPIENYDYRVGCFKRNMTVAEKLIYHTFIDYTGDNIIEDLKMVAFMNTVENAVKGEF